jgi:hypothetical protein
MIFQYFNNVSEYLKYKKQYYNEHNYDNDCLHINLNEIDEIIEIEEIGEMETIDIEVDGDNLFYCNDILVHNSAMGDMTDVTEEHIQGGVTKTQTADNVIAIIPSSAHRQANLMHMKLLKTRDSGGVWKTLKFIVDWEKLKITPMLNKDEIEKLSNIDNGCEYEFYDEEKTISKKNSDSNKKNKLKKSINEDDEINERNDDIDNEDNEKETNSIREKLKKRKKVSKLKISTKKPKLISMKENNNNDDDVFDEEKIDDIIEDDELKTNNPFSKKKTKLHDILDDGLSMIGKGK